MELDDDKIDSLASIRGTPLYIYDCNALRRSVARVRKAFTIDRFRLLFATMANDNPEILRLLASQQVGACVNSLVHLDLAMRCGMHGDDIQFTSTGITVADLRQLQELGVAVNLDSPGQVQSYFTAGSRRAVGIRINAGALIGQRSDEADRIGMDHGGLQLCRETVSRAGGMINGVHVYCGTNFRRAELMLNTLDKLFESVDQYQDLEYVNIGGGVGVDYSHDGVEFDWGLFGARVCQLCETASNRLGRKLRLVFEPGRSTVAGCGGFLTRVTDVKSLNGTRYLCVDSSIAVFPRPYHHPHLPHAVRVVGGDDSLQKEPTTIVGRTTFSGDIFGRYSLPRSIDRGDLLLFGDAGAYCESMIMRFLGQPVPESILIDTPSVR